MELDYFSQNLEKNFKEKYQDVRDYQKILEELTSDCSRIVECVNTDVMIYGFLFFRGEVSRYLVTMKIPNRRGVMISEVLTGHDLCLEKCQKAMEDLPYHLYDETVGF